jgi:hypothetical protein
VLRHTWKLVILATIIFFLIAWTLAQTPTERTLHVSKSEAENALRKLQAYSGARLPTLEGFVSADEPSLEAYQRGFYQYSIQVKAISATESLVHVGVKITAWHEDRDPSKSGYQVLPSNGRLEMDLLERLDAALSARSADANVPTQQLPQSSSKPTKENRTPVSSRTAIGRPSAEESNPFANPSTHSVSIPRRSEAMATNSPRDLMDRHIQQLTEEEQSLQEVLRNQAHPDNLAAVKAPRTPVLSRPLGSSSVLFLADAEDEFQVLGIQGDWVHVQISGLSRGWIRTAQLDLPGTLPSDPNGGPRVESKRDPFRQTREETSLFPGDWDPLRGKQVRIIWVQPNGSSDPGTAGHNKMNMAKALFRKTYPEIAQSSAPIDGVVIVLDSADGGMAAVTVSVLQRWIESKLSDEAFWKQCWFDPPGAFE